jgi:hypothetical protein
MQRGMFNITLSYCLRVFFIPTLNINNEYCEDLNVFYPEEKRILYFNALKNFKSLTVHLKLESTLEDRYRH